MYSDRLAIDAQLYLGSSNIFIVYNTFNWTNILEHSYFAGKGWLFVIFAFGPEQTFRSYKLRLSSSHFCIEITSNKMTIKFTGQCGWLQPSEIEGTDTGDAAVNWRPAR